MSNTRSTLAAASNFTASFASCSSSGRGSDDENPSRCARRCAASGRRSTPRGRPRSAAGPRPGEDEASRRAVAARSRARAG
eukprot:30941-Pelagococcus_subviridis.AAC.16